MTENNYTVEDTLEPKQITLKSFSHIHQIAKEGCHFKSQTPSRYTSEIQTIRYDYYETRSTNFTQIHQIS